MSYQAVPLGSAEGAKSPEPTVFTIHVEKIRLFSYCSFWGFVIFAAIMSSIFTWPNMSCVKEGVEMSGMDCADLIAVFGTNNVSNRRIIHSSIINPHTTSHTII